MRKQTIFAMLLAAGSTLLALLACEAILRNFAPQPDPYRSFRYPPTPFKPDLKYLFDTGGNLNGIVGPTRFSTNNAGLRGDHLTRPKPPDEYRTIALGGSTTRCTYVDDDAVWTAVLQRRLRIPGRRVKVYNAGVDGERSYGHYVSFASRWILESPDLIIVLAGVNDLTDNLCRHHRSGPGTANRDASRISSLTAFKLLATDLHVARLLVHAAKRLGGREYFTAEGWLIQDLAGKAYLASMERRRAAPVDEGARIEVDTSGISQHLRLLIRLAKANGIEVLLLTQPTLWKREPTAAEDRILHMDYRCGKRYPPHVLQAALAAYNENTRQIAADEGALCLDLAALLPPTLDYFYDDCHFNTEGCRFVGQAIADYLREQDLR